MQHSESVLWFKKELIEKMTNFPFEVILYAPQAETLRGKIEGNVDFRDIDINRRGINPIPDMLLLFNYLKIIREEKPDIVLTNAIKPNIYGNIAAKASKIPVISNVPGAGAVFQRKNSVLLSLICILYRWAFKYTKKIFFENEENAEMFIKRKLVQNKQVKIVKGSGVNINKFCPMPRHNEENPFVFLLIGRVMVDKGIREFATAATILKSKRSNIIFKIMGMVEDEELLKTVTSNNAVQYIGQKDDIRQDIAEADCIVLPSYHEGMANTLLEGAAMGKPLIASDISGCKEIVENEYNGFLCKAKDVDSLVDAMEKLLSMTQEQRNIMGNNGRKKMVLEFNRESVVDSYIEEIDEVINIKAML